jgi:SpoVK/Ycf46/Vps4 family AAA+-type ATPase
MFRRWPIHLAIAAGLFVTPDVFAGWVIIKNETKQALVVVEVAGTPNRPIQGKPVKLQPGETYREFQAGAGTKTFAIYDATKLNAPLAQQAVTWPAEDSTFGIRNDAKSVKLVSADSSKK